MRDRIVTVKVFAGSKKEKVNTESNPMEIYVREPAQNNMANNRVREIIADKFSVNKAQVKLITGHRARKKKLQIML